MHDAIEIVLVRGYVFAVCAWTAYIHVKRLFWDIVRRLGDPIERDGTCFLLAMYFIDLGDDEHFAAKWNMT